MEDILFIVTDLTIGRGGGVLAKCFIFVHIVF